MKRQATQGTLMGHGTKTALPDIPHKATPEATPDLMPHAAISQDDGRPTPILPQNAQDSLAALESVIKANLSGNKRQDELLAPPPASGGASPFVRFDASPETWPHGWCRGWAYTPPPSMSEILDIRLTPRKWKPEGAWTQGSNFAISEGHVIYRNDCLGVYEGQWSEALINLPEIHCLQVISAIPVAPSSIIKKTFFPLLEPPSEEEKKSLMAEIEARGNISKYGPGTNPDNKDEKGWILSERAWREAGNVTFAILEKQNGRLVKTGRHTVTQDEFVRLLITGEMP